MQPKYIHLRVHTEYSLVDGTVRIKPLIKRVVELGMPAVAISDQSNLFGLVKFYRAALAEGVKALIGADVWLYNPSEPAAPYRLSLLVQNQTGYRTLTELISLAYQQGQHQGVPMLHSEWLEAKNAGLIALSGGREGQIGQALLARNDNEAEACLEHWLRVFDRRLYVELQRTGRPGEEEYIRRALHLAAEFAAPVVATNDVRFLRREDFEAHEVRVCIHQGRVLDDPRRPLQYSEMQYLRSEDEMLELFADIPEALQNSVEIAKRCNLELSLGRSYLPEFPALAGISPEDYFSEQSRQGLAQRLARFVDSGQNNAEHLELYRSRLDTELEVIRQMGFSGYFLIVADFIRWAKQNGIPVGPGRGSGAGSLVAYALGITDLDPLRFDLLFERFLNPERVSMPDFDVDFCMERRDEVIDYVADRYGRDRVAQIITYGSMAARAVVRDVGRVLGHPYGFVDRLAKLIPFEIGMTLDKALADSEELRNLYQQDEEVHGLIDTAKSLEGIVRNAGKHAGGVVIAPSRLIDFTPLYCEPGGHNLVTQFDKDDVEAVGLVKFDFLGLRTLTIIDWAVGTINQRRADSGEPALDIGQIPLGDEPTYALLKRCATTAVFQLESRGMKDLIRRLQPDCFEDVIALVALFRPGPLQSGMVDDYINVKHKKTQAEYPHPSLETILRPTNGVILYQEQVMQIARDMAGYTLGSADLLRRAMGKKKPEEMAKQREIFVQGAVACGVSAKIASYIFDLMEKFAGYGFNKSHSAAYALVAYQTAWLKAHHPAAFMAAVLSSDMDNTDKIVVLIEECREMGLKILPPDINRSGFRFTAQDDGTILYGLGAIKGVGETAVVDILREREQRGVFKDLLALCRRIDLRKVNRRVLEALVRAGALDVIDPNRARHMAALPLALRTAEQHDAMSQAGQDDLFGLGQTPAPAVNEPSQSLQTTDPWPEEQRLAAEKATLGLYLTGHPISQYEPELAYFVTNRIAKLLAESDRSYIRVDTGMVVAGLLVELRTRDSKLGKRMAFATLDDRTGRLEVAIFADVYEKCRDYLVKDSLLVAEGSLAVDDYSGQLRLTAERLLTIEQARAHFAKSLLINWRGVDDARQGRPLSKIHLVEELQGLLAPFQGGVCPIRINYSGHQVRALIQLGQTWRVHPGDELLNRLQKKFGEGSVRVEYA